MNAAAQRYGTADAGVSRRAVVVGAAWSLPAIAVAVGMPLAAASTAPGASIRLDGIPSTLVTGVVITTATVTAAGADGELTVLLPSGFEWADGSGASGIPRRVGSDAGTFAVPAFRATAAGGNAEVVARSGRGTATARTRTVAPYELELLGGVNAIGDGPDEFRADLTAIVPAGTRPSRLEYAFYPLTRTGWTLLAPIADVQTSIGQNYGVVHVQPLAGGYERIHLSARGDADVPNAAHGEHLWPIRATWPGGAVSALEMPFRQVHSGRDGRPLAINAWDRITSGVPGYPGTNSQTGWGNVLHDGGPTTVSGDRFFVGAKTSGRTAAEGNDLTTEVLVQFVHESGVAASATPVPRRVTVPNYVSDASGVYLGSVLGDIELDREGYWKLLVWPQSSNSSELSTATPDRVAWDPAREQGHQVGSVFCRLGAAEARV